MKGIIVSILLVLLSSLAFSGQIDGKYIIVLKDTGTGVEVVAKNMAKKYGITLGHIYKHAIKGFSASIPATVLQKIKEDLSVKYIEKDKMLYAIGRRAGRSILTPPVQVIPTGINRIDVDLALDINNIDDESLDVDIAIIDTGVDLDHPDLNIAGDVTFVRGTRSGNDDNGHGTHVAGIVAAIDNEYGVVGVAPGARLWAVKVLDRNGSGALSDVIAGIDWVTDNSDVIEVANMSLGGVGYSQALRDAITASVSKGVFYAVAAGNDSDDVYGEDGEFGTEDDYIPAAYPEVATVSAMVDTDGQAGGNGLSTPYGADDTLATFSNYSDSVVAGNPVSSPGTAIDLAAPGVIILSTYLDGTYVYMTGTSMAVPHVAGAAALYIARSEKPKSAKHVYEVRQALINLGQPQGEWGPADTGDPDGNLENLVYVGGL